MTAPQTLPPITEDGPFALHRWIDETTGREVRQVTASDSSVAMPYFRMVKHVYDGRIFAKRHLLDVETGQAARVPLPEEAWPLQLHPDGRQLFWGTRGRELGVCDLATGESRVLGSVAELDIKPREFGVSLDGRTFLAACRNEDLEKYPTPWGVRDGAALHQWFERPRTGDLWAYDLPTGQFHHLLHLADRCPIHLDPSPADPGLLKFSHDKFDAYCQRMWTLRTDGSDLRPIRRQERGELITHEFWWPDGQYIGFKYQDRRQDPTIEEVPWAEYATVPTQFGLAGLDGEEAYLSDPLNHYHSHIHVSRDGKWLCGEGTDHHSFVCAAAFDIASTRVDFVPLATIHTPYSPLAGQSVNASFTCDGKWLLYNDTVEGQMAVCAVRVDL